MSKSCSVYCCDKPAIAQSLVRLGIGGLFLVPGIMKLMDPAIFQGMLGVLFGWTGLLLTIVFWVVVAFEILGGLFVLIGPLVPKWLYKLSLLGLLIISIVALIFVNIASGDLMGILFQSFATLMIVALMITQPLCPFCPKKGCKM